jgi:predicted kinase
MARLILLNGPPACGKSTLARRYADDHPLTLNLDIDSVRGLIGGWRDDRHNAGLAARAIALSAARTHLTAGHDVIVPQFLGRPAFILQLEHLAHNVGAVFHEIVLRDSKGNMLRRYAERADPFPGESELSMMHDRLESIIAARQGAIVVQVADGDPDRTYRAVLRCLT